MKRIVIVLLIIILVAMAAACGSSTPEPSLTTTLKPTPTPSPTVTPSPTLIPTQAPEPDLSYTTGLPFEGEYKPVLVVIENSPQARPQTGLQMADVVYEVPVEGSITRFVCVFSDNIPEMVMPVRSGRVPFLYIQHEWDAVFMHFGGASSENKKSRAKHNFFGHELHDDIKIVLDGMSSKGSKYYKRDNKISMPHNVMGYPQLAQQLYDYTPEPLNWTFDSNVSYEAEEALELNLKMCSGDDNFISYTYDPENDVYMRFMNGKKFMCAETDAQLAVKNLIVQYSTYETERKGGTVYKLWKLVGSGDADFYIGGKLIHGRWERQTEDSKTIFYDNTGNKIALKPGNTWIHISPKK